MHTDVATTDAAVRIAAVGDLHIGKDSAEQARHGFSAIGGLADVLLLAGDLTQHGSWEEGKMLADALAGLGVPVVAVLGNHDYHSGAEARIQHALEDVGVVVLEGDGVVVATRAGRVGIAGVKGFGGGFAGACGTDFGEPEMKAFIRHTKHTAQTLHDALAGLDSAFRIALTHYAPIKETLMGERFEIYPFLGSYLLAEAIDQCQCHLALHGHAHRGTEYGVTPGGVPVRNVARPVIRRPYKIYCLSPGASPAVMADAELSQANTVA